MMLTLSSRESVLPYLIYTEEWTLGVAVLRAPQSYHLSVPVQDATLQMHLLFQDSNTKRRKILNERTDYFTFMESQQFKRSTFLEHGCLTLEN